MFQFFSKRFETIESVDLDIFSPFQFVSAVLLYNLYVSMFRNIRYWVTGDNEDFVNFMRYIIFYIAYIFQCFNLLRNMWSYLFQYCFETFRNRRNMRTLSIL